MKAIRRPPKIMINFNLRNNFQDLQIVRLSSWRQANEVTPRDHGEPYMVTHEGYDPEDMKVIAEAIVLGRSGKWLSLGHFFRMSVSERRAEFIFGTAGEVMKMMNDLPSKAAILRPGDKSEPASPAPGQDEMAAACQAGKSRSTGSVT